MVEAGAERSGQEPTWTRGSHRTALPARYLLTIIGGRGSGGAAPALHRLLPSASLGFPRSRAVPHLLEVAAVTTTSGQKVCIHPHDPADEERQRRCCARRRCAAARPRRPPSPVAAAATTMDWASIILPITPPVELAEAIRDRIESELRRRDFLKIAEEDVARGVGAGQVPRRASPAACRRSGTGAARCA